MTEENWRDSITNLHWKKNIKCPYCGYEYLDVGYLAKAHEDLYILSCPECKMRESWLTEHNLYTTYEEELDIYG